MSNKYIVCIIYTFVIGSHGEMNPILAKDSVKGIGVYSAQQLEKLLLKFPKENLTYTFDDWNKWREEDGLLCRNHSDCSWVYGLMYCKDYELGFTPNVSKVHFKFLARLN